MNCIHATLHRVMHLGTSDANSIRNPFTFKCKLLVILLVVTESDFDFSFQVSDIIAGKSSDMTAREALLLWSQRTTDGYPGVKIRNLTTSWSDGLAFNAIIHRNR